MKPDQAIEEIRDVRKRISHDYHDDISALLNHYRSLESNYANRLIHQHQHHKTSSISYVHENSTSYSK
jgi:hypothetical protein